MSGKKVTTSVIAIVMALAIALSGTFAWQSISQTALNEAMGANPGGRLHDDFSGPGGTKDIYVENFGSLPIYARVRLDEYMEIGPGAGTKDGTTGNSTAASLVTGADIDDVTTWTTHIPGASSADTGAGTESPTWATAGETFHKYWVWTMGGQDTANNPNGTTIYMPTFNKNQDSLHADINGTLEGTIAGDAVHYDDYTAYTNGQQVTADAYYDADNNTTDEDPTKPGNGGTQGTNYTVVNETHTAKSTEAGKVITMAEWKALADTDPGNGTEWKGSVQAWVYDTDGWAYWSQPIAPNTATGLLLDKIAQTNATINGEWYYAINAVGQFITADDLGSAANTDGFYSNGGAAPSSDALTLLETIGVNTSGSTPASGVSIMEGSAVVTRLSMAPNDTKTLTVSAPAAASGNWTWNSSVPGIVTATGTGTDNKDCTVTAETDGVTIITATNDANPALTASVTVTVATPTPAYTVSIKDSSSTPVTSGSTVNMTRGDQPSFTATVSNTVSGGKWVWSSGVAAAATVIETSRTANSSTATVITNAAGTSLITAEYRQKNGTMLAKATFTANVKPPAEGLKAGDTQVLDGVRYTVLALNNNLIGTDGNTYNAALLLSTDIQETEARPFDLESHTWHSSAMRTRLNSTWLTSHSEVAAKAIEVPISTRLDRTTVESKTDDKVFLLSEADMYGTSNDGEDTSPQSWEYTYNGAKLAYFTTDNEKAAAGGTYWLRSPGRSASYVAVVGTDGTREGVFYNNPRGGVRPAFWYNLAS